MAIDPKKTMVKVLKKVDPEKKEKAKGVKEKESASKNKSESKVIKDENGGNSMRTTTTNHTPGTPDRVIKGTPSTTVKGKPGSAAVLPSKGIKGGPDFDKAFGAAKSAGKEVFTYNGKKFKVVMSGTKGKPAVKQTPDIVTPGTPDRVIKGTEPTSKTVVTDKKIPSEVYTVTARRGTIGGAKRDGIGGAVTTGKQVTSNKEVSDRAVKAQKNYNTYVDKKYAPDTANERGLNPAQLKNKNEKAEQRRKDLQGNTSVTLTPVQSGLERKKVEEMRRK